MLKISAKEDLKIGLTTFERKKMYFLWKITLANEQTCVVVNLFQNKSKRLSKIFKMKKKTKIPKI